MDPGSLVDSQLEDAKRLILQLVRDDFGVTVAAWVKTEDDGRWYFYVVSPMVGQEGPAAAYGRVQTAFAQLCPMSFELFDVKVLDESEPLARGLRSDLGYLDRHLKGRMRAPVQGVTPRIGTVPVDDVYIYPGIFYEKAEPTSMTPEQITQKALELMSRTGTVQPSDVRLRDGETIQGFPVGIELMNNVMTIKFAVDHASTLRAYPINEIAEIR